MNKIREQNMYTQMTTVLAQLRADGTELKHNSTQTQRWWDLIHIEYIWKGIIEVVGSGGSFKVKNTFFE